MSSFALKWLVGAGIVAALAVAIWIENASRLHWKAQYEALHQAEIAAAAAHRTELEQAHRQSAADLDALGVYYRDHPFTVRVPVRCAPVPAGAAPSTGASPTIDVAPAVPTGDRGLPSGPDPVIISNLYGAYSKVFAQALIDLKEQQAVK